ncbi:MAG TPA: hypothetical protein VN041_14040 [Microbacterium sp.]|nr:hypothetical protein [Microbacterium sp.]
MAAEQKAAADEAADEKQAADEKAKQDAATKAAADKAAADAKATASTKKSKDFKVVGAAVVLRSEDGSERYLYRGAPVDPAAWSKDSIKHAIAVGLIAEA